MHVPQYPLLPDLPTFKASRFSARLRAVESVNSDTEGRYSYVQLKLMIKLSTTAEKGMGPLPWTAYLVLTFQSKFITLQLIFKDTSPLKVLSVSGLFPSTHNDTVHMVSLLPLSQVSNPRGTSSML